MGECFITRHSMPNLTTWKKHGVAQVPNMISQLYISPALDGAYNYHVIHIEDGTPLRWIYNTRLDPADVTNTNPKHMADNGNACENYIYYGGVWSKIANYSKSGSTWEYICTYKNPGSYRTVQSGTKDACGDFIEDVLCSKADAYPNNGKHTDGYWYVKQ